MFPHTAVGILILPFMVLKWMKVRNFLFTCKLLKSERFRFSRKVKQSKKQAKMLKQTNYIISLRLIYKLLPKPELKSMSYTFCCEQIQRESYFLVHPCFSPKVHLYLPLPWKNIFSLENQRLSSIWTTTVPWNLKSTFSYFFQLSSK